MNRLVIFVGIAGVAIYALCKLVRLVNVLRLIHRTGSYPTSIGTDHVAIRMFGDSVAKGVGSSDFAHSLCGLVQQRFSDKSVDCVAQSGQFLDQTEQLLLKNNYSQDVAILFGGGMDVLYKTTKAYNKTVPAVIAALVAQSKSVIVFIPSNAGKIGFFPRPFRSVLQKRSFALESAILAAAEQHDSVHTINLLESGGRDIKPFPKQHFASDMVHPNDESLEEWFGRLEVVLGEVT